MTWRILYRGSLNSCNYSCQYCPFAKKDANRKSLEKDADELERFVNWVKQQKQSIRLMFTPWGEALIWPAYQKAIVNLSRMSHVETVTIQTNLSGKLDWISRGNSRKMFLWASYHPDEISLDSFVASCFKVVSQGAQISVGMVGFSEKLSRLEQLRDRLPPEVYVWVNAHKGNGVNYSDAESSLISAIDPFFIYNQKNHSSLGKACDSGHSVFTVDGSGNVRRCHFIAEVIGNIYSRRLQDCLQQLPCTEATCGCYIGYIHLKELEFEKKFGANYFERNRG